MTFSKSAKSRDQAWEGAFETLLLLTTTIIQRRPAKPNHDRMRMESCHNNANWCVQLHLAFYSIYLVLLRAGLGRAGLKSTLSPKKTSFVG